MPLAHVSWALADNADRPACDAFFIDLMGAVTAYEMLVTPETEKYRFDREERLMVVANAMLIPIAPAGDGARAGNALGDMLRRNAGENRWLGLSLRTADLKAADAWLTARGFRLHYDRGMENNYFLISPRQVLGMRIEVMKGDLPGDPRVKPGWTGADWQHGPLGIEGLVSVDIAVPSPDAARELFGARLGWPDIGSRTVGDDGWLGAGEAIAFDMGDCVLEALVAIGQGSRLAAHAEAGRGVCGITFQVRDGQAAWDHLAARGFALIGDTATRFAIRPDQAHGRLVWFTDAPPACWPGVRSRLTQAPAFPAPDDGALPVD